MISLFVRCGESSGQIDVDMSDHNQAKALEYLLAVAWGGLKSRMRNSGYDPDSAMSFFEFAVNNVKHQGPNGKIQRDLDRLMRKIKDNPEILHQLKEQLEEHT